MNAHRNRSRRAKALPGTLDLRTLTAYHEAGHAIVALAVCRDILRVSVDPDDTSRGRTELVSLRERILVSPDVEPDPVTRRILERDALFGLGGIASERLCGADVDPRGSRSDLEEVLARLMCASGSDDEALSYAGWLLSRAETMLRRRWRNVRRLARELTRRGTLTGVEVRRLLDRGSADPARARGAE